MFSLLSAPDASIMIKDSPDRPLACFDYTLKYNPA